MLDVDHAGTQLLPLTVKIVVSWWWLVSPVWMGWMVTELAGPGWLMVSGTDMLDLDMLRLSWDLALDSWNIFRSAAS